MDPMIKISILVIALSISSIWACDERGFTLVNNCNATLWIGQTSSAYGGGGWEMSPGDIIQKCVAGNWSGRFWPRTFCNFAESGACPTAGVDCCKTGGCLGTSGNFSLACRDSGVPPVTVAEFTLSPTTDGSDYYDVSQVDGGTIPIEITTTPGTYRTKDEVDLYWCGNPGCTAKTCVNTQLGTCSWEYNPGSYDTVLQMSDPTQCGGDSDCESGTSLIQICKRDDTLISRSKATMLSQYLQYNLQYKL
jgi:hypothetical protein